MEVFRVIVICYVFVYSIKYFLILMIIPRTGSSKSWEYFMVTNVSLCSRKSSLNCSYWNMFDYTVTIPKNGIFSIDSLLKFENKWIIIHLFATPPREDCLWVWSRSWKCLSDWKFIPYIFREESTILAISQIEAWNLESDLPLTHLKKSK